LDICVVTATANSVPGQYEPFKAPCSGDTARVLQETRLFAIARCSHGWEHLTEQEGQKASEYCFSALKPGGYLRCAVPDRNFPNADYQKDVQIGGPGPADHPAADHKIVYAHRLFVSVSGEVGFEVDLLESCDDQGRFHYNEWSFEQGKIYRSLLSDHPNKGGNLGFCNAHR
jgi:predicted SAM-dependent methyltransferase